MSLDLAARLVGGVGLFLLGMRLMTDGLKLAAGHALRDILRRSTGTLLRGVASGVLVTSLVQSSSAVTVATIGFVNAGILTLGQALAVTYGSNIGTTMTGWLVAAIGFQLNVKAFALPLVGFGMGLRVFARTGRLGPLGEALAGFGIFFMGIDVLRAAFEGVGDQIEFSTLAGTGISGALLCVAIGFALTLLMQSSSAAIAIVLTAVGGGVVSLGSGAALVIGANVGTTSTAALAVIGATPNAKRVAAGHVVFNLVTGAVALALLPLLLALLAHGRELLRLEAQPAAVLAAFHTLFNLLGVALLWPLTGRLLHFLEARFRATEEDEARPVYLDANVVTTPRLAIDAMALELARAGQIARRLAGAALGASPQARDEIAAGREALDSLVEAIGTYAQLLQRNRIPRDLDALLPTALRVSRYYSEVAELAVMVDAGRVPLALKSPALEQEIAHFLDRVRVLVRDAGVEHEAYGTEAIAEQLGGVEADYAQLKSQLLEAGSQALLPVRELVEVLDWLSNVRRLAQQIERAARFLASMGQREGEPRERLAGASQEGQLPDDQGDEARPDGDAPS